MYNVCFLFCYKWRPYIPRYERDFTREKSLHSTETCVGL